ncbi:MAG: peptide chain release factor 2 [Candidatus Lambdaproteobacteria bacterium]|nr:peptide chain release factor 2 [Candidatus Lambdaproteobacteria bacterium]
MCAKKSKPSKPARNPSRAIFDLPKKSQELESLQARTVAESFWALPPQERAALLKQQQQLSNLVEEWQRIGSDLEELETGIALCEEEHDAELAGEVEALSAKLEQRLGALELRNMLGGEHDARDAIAMIHSGAGGTESADWAGMLFRMYQRWAESRGHRLTVLDLQPGDEGGLKSVTFSVVGDYAYGHLKAEMGVHRLVRISPYDANKRRHTSFASVFVYPDVEDEIEVQINDADLRIDIFRSSGPGGQSVNTTDSAVRITHLPTGIVVQCQNERSQFKNKHAAMKVLKARLYERERQEREAERDKLNENKREIAWGSQIRSYVLHPYQLVKDHRTDYETGNAQRVLDGDIEDFIEQALIKKVV